MKSLTRFISGAAIGLAVAVTAAPAAFAETPANMLVIANRIDDITTLDPAESFEFAGSDVNRNIYQKLVNFDPANLDAGYQPEIAESWTVSDDGTTITFTIRDGLKFHSGNPVTAADVEFSLRRAVILNKTPSFILTQFGFTADNVGDTIVADGNTIKIRTDKPYATSFVLNCLTSTIGGIVTTPVINHPETAIIGVNKMQTLPRYDEAGRLVPRNIMNLSSSFDHRIVDGYEAAQLIQAMKALLENPATLFM